MDKFEIKFGDIAKAVSGTVRAMLNDRLRTRYIAEITGTQPFLQGEKRSLSEIVTDFFTGNTSNTARRKGRGVVFIDTHVHPSEVAYDSEANLRELVDRGMEIGLDVMACVSHVNSDCPEHSSIYDLLTQDPPESITERYIVNDKSYPLVQLIDKQGIDSAFNKIVLHHLGKKIRTTFHGRSLYSLDSEEQTQVVNALPKRFKKKYSVKDFADLYKFFEEKNQMHILDGYELKVQGPTNAEVLVYGYRETIPPELPLDEALQRIPARALKIASHVEFLDSLKAEQAEKLMLKESHIGAAVSMFTQWGPATAKHFYENLKSRYRTIKQRATTVWKYQKALRNHRFQDKILAKQGLEPRYEKRFRHLCNILKPEPYEKKLRTANTIASSDAHHAWELGSGITISKRQLDFSSGPEFLDSLKSSLYRRKHKRVEHVPSTMTFLYEGGFRKIATAFSELVGYSPEQ